jgi:hypothetical protein
MRQVMVRYRVKPERVEENEELVRAVYDEIHRTAPAGLGYATFKLDEGVSYVHLAVFEGESDGSPLSKVEAFRRFQDDIEERTDDGPVVTELDRIGSFRLMDEPRVH